jgi:hypothetical protein
VVPNWTMLSTMISARTTRNESFARLALALGAIVLAAGCGRTDLDFGAPATVAVSTGGDSGSSGTGGRGDQTATGQGGQAAGGTGGQPGAGGQAGGPTGAGGRPADAGVDAGGGRGGNAGASGSGGAAGAPAATPIPCGMTTCAPRAAVCCLQRMNGRATQTCVASAAACASGMSVGCVDASDCARGQFCCATAVGVSTTCTDAATCARQPGVIVCNRPADCPATAANCCMLGGAAGVCSAQRCPGPGGG